MEKLFVVNNPSAFPPLFTLMYIGKNKMVIKEPKVAVTLKSATKSLLDILQNSGFGKSNFLSKDVALQFSSRPLD